MVIWLTAAKPIICMMQTIKARNIVTLPTETRVKDAAGNVKAKSQMAYDEVSTYPIISAGTDSQWTED